MIYLDQGWIKSEFCEDGHVDKFTEKLTLAPVRVVDRPPPYRAGVSAFFDVLMMRGIGPPTSSGREKMIGTEKTVVDCHDHSGRVMWNGENGMRKVLNRRHCCPAKSW